LPSVSKIKYCQKTVELIFRHQSLDLMLIFSSSKTDGNENCLVSRRPGLWSQREPYRLIQASQEARDLIERSNRVGY